MTLFSDFVSKELKKEDLIGAEIGVRIGQNAIFLLEALSIKKIYLVDPFIPYQDGREKYWKKEEQEEQYQQLLKNVIKYKEVEIVKLTSKEAREKLRDIYFDFVYIDANHEYESVKDDLDWWKLLKIGGILGGHDYADWKGVKKAIDEFAKEKNLYLHILGQRQGGGVEWAIIKK